MMNRRKLFGFLAIAPMAVPVIAKEAADVAQMMADCEANQIRAGGFIYSNPRGMLRFSEDTGYTWKAVT